MKIELGSTMKDKITGFQGVVMGHCVYMSGCNQTLLSPPVKENGEFKDAHWFDDQRLERVGTEVIKLDNDDTPGCDQPAPLR